MQPRHLKSWAYAFAIATLVFLAPTSRAQSATEEWVFTMGGDINFNSGNLKRLPLPAPNANGGYAQGQIIPYESLTQYLAYHVDGDLNFANIETVISDRTDLRASKTSGYAFVSHPNGLEHLINDLGFNWFSLANNHAWDFGYEGYKETLTYFDKYKAQNPTLLYSGVGWNREDALTPKITEVNGLRVAFVAISVTDPAYKATDSKPGMLNFRDDNDYFALLDRLAHTEADYKVVSIHFGTEKQIDLDEGQARRFRLAATRGGANLVLGHHPHVVRPIEVYPDQGEGDRRNGQSSIIFYSFGNYLMLGAANMDSNDPGKDWGLLARLFLSRGGKGSPVVHSALELIPLKGMHQTPWAVADKFTPSLIKEDQRFDISQDRLSRLYNLGLKQLPHTALEFGLSFKGHGITCFDTYQGVRAYNICGGGTTQPR